MVIIGGWSIRAGDCAYEAATGDFNLHVARGTEPESGNKLALLWSAAVDESGDGAALVTLRSFDPAAIPIGSETGAEMKGSHALAEGHVLRLRAFDHEPTTGELTSGAQLWQS